VATPKYIVNFAMSIYYMLLDVSISGIYRDTNGSDQFF
jgi:hypothetical protein